MHARPHAIAWPVRAADPTCRPVPFARATCAQHNNPAARLRRSTLPAYAVLPARPRCGRRALSSSRAPFSASPPAHTAPARSAGGTRTRGSRTTPTACAPLPPCVLGLSPAGSGACGDVSTRGRGVPRAMRMGRGGRRTVRGGHGRGPGPVARPRSVAGAAHALRADGAGRRVWLVRARWCCVAARARGASRMTPAPPAPMITLCEDAAICRTYLAFSTTSCSTSRCRTCPPTKAKSAGSTAQKLRSTNAC
jgi:hypothetical protein